MPTEETLYLSSLESARFKVVRECKVASYLHFDTGKAAALVHVQPEVIGQPFGLARDIDELVLIPRHERVSVDSICEFPCFVFIAIPQDHCQKLSTPIRASDLQVIGWGELYRSAQDAEQHKFR